MLTMKSLIDDPNRKYMYIGRDDGSLFTADLHALMSRSPQL